MTGDEQGEQTAAGCQGPNTHHGLSLDPFAEKTVCCLLLEVSRLSLGVLNGFEVLLAEFWPLRQAFVFTCTNDVLELEGGEAGEGEGLHIEPCLLSTEEERRELSTSSEASETHMLMHKYTTGKDKSLYLARSAPLSPSSDYDFVWTSAPILPMRSDGVLHFCIEWQAKLIPRFSQEAFTRLAFCKTTTAGQAEGTPGVPRAQWDNHIAKLTPRQLLGGHKVPQSSR